MKPTFFCYIILISTTCFGSGISDFDGNGITDLEDFRVIAENWLSTDLTCNTDTTIVVAASDCLEEIKAGADFVCDGVDDQVELQAAINLLDNKGGKVILTHGTFYISGTVYLADRVGLEGQNLNTSVIKASSAFAGDLVVWRPKDLEKVDYYANLTRLKIDGNGQGTGLVTEAGVSDFYMDHVMISNCYNGATFQGSWGYKVTNCLFEFNKNRAIDLHGPGQVIIQGCFIAYNEGEYAMVVGPDSNPVTIQGCFFNGNYNCSLLVVGTNHIINGNVFQHKQAGGGLNKDCLVLDTAASGCIVTGNLINGKGTARYGIRVRSIDNLIGNNRIFDCLDAAIHREAPANLIMGNQGFVTENGGSASVKNGDLIAHGLSETPTSISLTASVPGHIVSAASVDQTHITIGLVDTNGLPIETAETVYWQANVK